MNTTKQVVEIRPGGKKKKIQARTGFEPMTFAIPVQCSTNWANKPTVLDLNKPSKKIVVVSEKKIEELFDLIWHDLLYFWLCCFSLEWAVYV